MKLWDYPTNVNWSLWEVPKDDWLILLETFHPTGDETLRVDLYQFNDLQDERVH